MKKLRAWILTLAMVVSLLPTMIVSAETQAWVNLEAEDALSITDMTILERESASGGGVLYIGTDDTSKTPGIEMTFEVPDSGMYDLWILTDASSGDHVSKTYATLNSGEATRINASGAAASSELYKVSGGYLGYQAPMKWVKVYSGTELSSGTSNTLSINADTTTMGTSTYYLAFFDAIRIVPTEWEWVPDATLDEPEPFAFKADSNGMVWMEAEDAAITDSNLKTIKSLGSSPEYMSGNDCVYVATGTVKEKTSHDMPFKIDTEGVYDIWAAVVAGGNYYLHTYALTDNSNETIFSIKPSSGSNAGYIPSDAPVLGKHSAFGSSFEIRWVKVSGATRLTAGRYNMNVSTDVLYNAFTFNMFDCMAVVPSEWNWTPDGDVTKPEPSTATYAWIELENNGADVSGTDLTKTDGGTTANGYQSGRYLYATESNSALTNDLSYSYDFELANSGTYDVYYLGHDISANYLSKVLGGIDAEATVLTTSGKSVKMYEYRSGGLGAYWQKIMSATELSAGEHKLNLTFNPVETKDSEGVVIQIRQQVCADTIVIVPTSWAWEMPETAEAAGQTAADLDATAKQQEILANHGEELTENITELEPRGVAGSYYTYGIESESGTIADDGTITRGAEDDMALIVVTANKQIKSDKSYAFTGEREIELTVLASKDIDYKNYAVTYSDGSEISSIISGATINAGVRVKTNNPDKSSALLALAVYKNGVLEDVESKSITLTSEYQDLNTSITLPVSDDMTGYTVKAFLWDSLSSLKPYCKAAIHK